MTGRSGVGGRGGAAAAAHQTGLELLRGGDAARALPELEQAAKLDPENPEYLKDQGNAYKALGRLEAAVDSYRRSVAASPDYAPARYNLGLALRELDRAEEAEAQFRHLHERDPRDIEALFNLADLLATRSRYPEAMALYRAALEIAPDNPYLWLELGKVCTEVPGQLEDAVRCLQSCIGLKPDIADAHYAAGLALRRLGRNKEAGEHYQTTLELEPGHAAAHNDLGNILQDEGRLEQAAHQYRNAIAASPSNALAYSNLGNALSRLGRLAEAIESYRKAIQLDPAFPDAYLNLGAVHALAGAHDQALRCYETVVRLQPGSAFAQACRLYEKQRMCDWSHFDELCEERRRAVRDQPELHLAPFSLLSIPSAPELQLQCVRTFSAHCARAVAHDRERLRFRFERKPNSKLRIGYLSADFHEHATAYLAAELFELHDRGQFEVVGYSYGPDDRSAVRERLKRGFDRFVDVAPLSHADAAERIHRDGVDILVDLKGYTTHARPEILAMRPAPIQVHYLGYPGTLGADFIDYIVTDRFITRPGQESHFTEATVCMPASYQVNDRRRAVASTPSRADLGLPEGRFVYCCFNHTYKILPDVFAIWMRLLQAVPGSVLWLLESNPWAAENLRREAQRHGVEPARLIFAPLWPQDKHLGRLRAADVFLDTFPYNAHTTTSDALWVGLPVVTCSGDTFASRVAGSLLTAAGLPELVTHTPEEYEALAMRLARIPAELSALRARLDRNRLSAPLFDTPAFTRKLEEAYRRMWDNHLAGGRPRTMEIQP